MFHGAQVSKNPAPQGGEPGLRRDTALVIDIGKDRHFVAVDPERTEEPVRSFGAFVRPAIWRRWRRGWRRVG